MIESRQPLEVNIKQTLKSGQIVRANIAKLFSNGRALINLGNQQLVAQLEAALAVGKSYHFQVQQTEGQTIHLRVLSEVTPDQSQDLKNLLRLFNFKESTYKLNFLRSLIGEQISFNKNDLQAAFKILRGGSSSTESHTLLKQMISRGLPITENVFNALRTVNDLELTSLLRQLNSSIQANSSEALNHIKSLLNKPQEQGLEFLINKISSNPKTTTLFRSLGFHISSTNIYTHNEQAVFPSNTQAMTSVNEVIHSILKNEQILIERSNNLLQNLDRLQAQNFQQYERELSGFKQEFRETILPLLSEKHRAIFSQIGSSSSPSPEELSQVTNLLEALSNRQTYSSLANFKQLINYDFPRESFSKFLNQSITEIGFNYEHELINNNYNHTNQATLKGQLVSLLNTAEFANNEQMQQVLNFINGAQIQSMQETMHFLQANLIVLGEQFGFDKDIYLNFEGKKTREDKLDPDFCRILFFLDLKTLNETVIDMAIQDRLITIQIFNEQPKFLGTLAKDFEDKLKSSLEKMNYTLSKISFSPFNKEKRTQKFTIKEGPSKEGIDFRI